MIYEKVEAAFPDWQEISDPKPCSNSPLGTEAQYYECGFKAVI